MLNPFFFLCQKKKAEDERKENERREGERGREQARFLRKYSNFLFNISRRSTHGTGVKRVQKPLVSTMSTRSTWMGKS